MADFGRPLQFGHFLVPDSSQPLLDQAIEAESLRLDCLGIQDHPYQRRFVDTLSLIASIAGTTERIRLFPDVACLPLRPPAVLAKTAATIDSLSGGRFELGLGAGGFWDAISGYGGERRSPGEALEALGEAIDVIRLIWSGERGLRYEGRHYHLAGVHGGPSPAHPVGIWLGVYGPRALALAGEKADGWVPSHRGDVSALESMSRRLDAAAMAAGRDPADIRRVLNVSGSIGPAASEGPITGPVELWVEELTSLVSVGFDTFVFGNPDADQVRIFAEGVAPAVREAVAGERSR